MELADLEGKQNLEKRSYYKGSKEQNLIGNPSNSCVVKIELEICQSKSSCERCDGFTGQRFPVN